MIFAAGGAIPPVMGALLQEAIDALRASVAPAGENIKHT